MKVKIYDCNRYGSETFRCVADLRNCFEDGDNEYFTAKNEIEKSGRYWVGGGAAPLVLLTRTQGE